MTVERLNLGGKNVLVGIRFDAHANELLDWAMVKVADPGDSVVAIFVSRNSDCVSRNRELLDGYLEDYEGLCNKRQVALTAQVLKGISLRRIMVREAKNHCASAVVVGINKHTALGGWGSLAKYCAKRLPPTIEVTSIYNGKVVFRSGSKILVRGLPGSVLDPKPSFYMKESLTFKDNHSEFGESEVSEISRFSFDTRDDVPSPVGRHKRSSLSSIELPAEDFTKQRPGWPLLQTTTSVTQPVLEARKLSVVQWVMSLPRRISPTSYKTEDPSREELPKDLETVLTKCWVQCKLFGYDLLKSITSEFSSGNLIGTGGCNSVYHGILPEGKPVAVKVLRSSKEARTNFVREVEIITSLKHKRISPLIGICTEERHLMSVYDYMSKGSLEDNLHGNKKDTEVLSWETRFQIAVGIAEALNYLHGECQRPVIHRDIKSSNILLTEELEPQLCDFGLAIWGPMTAPFLMDSDVVGTFGYLAPEYFMYGKVSDKIDVYAFGVILLELLSGRKPIGLETTKACQESLVMWAKPRLENKDYYSILDPNLDGNIDENRMKRMAHAAALCLTQAARLRPKISLILNILNGEESVDGSRQGCDDSDNLDYINDDEVYPESCAESHLSVAFLDVNDKCTSSSFGSSSSPVSVEEYLKKRCSRV